MYLGTHTGTHIDAPHHFIEEGISIDKVPLEVLTGKCRVIEISYNESSITANILSTLNIKKGERILFKTINSTFIKSDKRFHEDYVYISNDGAKYLADAGEILVGVDYLSIEGYGKGHETHRIMLGAGIIAIEGLCLGDVPAGEYSLTALPLKVKGADGAPARVVLMK